MNDISDKNLDDLIHRGFAGPVEDDGFSKQVMKALPVRQRKRSWLLPGTALTGGLLAWLTLLPSPLLQQVAQEWLAREFSATSVGVCVLLFGISLFSCGWALEQS